MEVYVGGKDLLNGEKMAVLMYKDRRMKRYTL
jgi:hypothetical protein